MLITLYSMQFQDLLCGHTASSCSSLTSKIADSRGVGVVGQGTAHAVILS